MNRRNFLKFLGVASVGATVAYSFPEIIVPKSIIPVSCMPPISYPVLEQTYKRLLERHLEPDRLIILKARQLGLSTLNSYEEIYKRLRSPNYV